MIYNTNKQIGQKVWLADCVVLDYFTKPEHKSDQVHFSAIAQREIGKMYTCMYLQTLKKKEKALEEWEKNNNHLKKGLLINILMSNLASINHMSLKQREHFVRYNYGMSLYSFVQEIKPEVEASKIESNTQPEKSFKQKKQLYDYIRDMILPTKQKISYLSMILSYFI